jgi:hypothetical protein
MIIRWLGAFGRYGALSESLQFEFSRSSEVAAELLQNGESHIVHAKVGLLIKNSALLKSFNGDCYSEYTSEGTLVKNRNPRNAKSTHQEVWTKPVYTGIVIKESVSPKIYAILKEVSAQYNVPIFQLKGGRLIKR